MATPTPSDNTGGGRDDELPAAVHGLARTLMRAVAGRVVETCPGKVLAAAMVADRETARLTNGTRNWAAIISNAAELFSAQEKQK